MQEQTLKGEVVLVTGAGSGLGEATARAFARTGCIVACLDINRESAERVAHDLQTQEAQSISLGCDVSNADMVFACVQRIAEQFGRLDIVVNCAAIDHTLSVAEMSIEQWDQVIGVNLRGPFLLAKAALPFMLQQHTG